MSFSEGVFYQSYVYAEIAFSRLEIGDIIGLKAPSLLVRSANWQMRSEEPTQDVPRAPLYYPPNSLHKSVTPKS